MLRSIALPSGERVAALGQGTWMMAERPGRRAEEIAALQLGVELGMTLIDTAEMYGSGEAEKLVAEALGGRRHDVFLVGKVLPQNASRRGTVAACESTLKRLRTDRLDLYLLHWRGSVPLEETLEAFDALQRAGKIRYWGVSNFDVSDMEDLVAATGADGAAATNQVLYNPMRRGIEYSLLPWCQARGLPIMAYSPLEQGRLLRNRSLRAISARLNATAAQVALAWVLRRDGIIAIPKSGNIERVRENRGALDVALAPEDLAELDEAFPPPTREIPLEMI